jgi:hypothetical protein
VGDLIALIVSGALWVFRAEALPVGAPLETPVHDVAGGFSSAIASWNVETQGGSWIAVELRARVDGRWTRWYSMGEWSATLDGGHRHSFADQSDGDGRVDTDTLNLRSTADALQLRAFAHAGPNGTMPKLHLLAVSTDNGEAPLHAGLADVAAWGVDLDVPQLSQRVGREGGKYGGGGGSWCSPTSVAMVMGYWSERLHRPDWRFDVEQAAEHTYDPVYDGCGNWPFNVAFASEHGLRGWVERFGSLADVERAVAAGMPIIASIKVKPGELAGSPYRSTDGHLLVVRGFTADGDVVCNDPAGETGAVKRIYRRAQFLRVWQDGSRGAVYVIAPPSLLPIPSP